MKRIITLVVLILLLLQLQVPALAETGSNAEDLFVLNNSSIADGDIDIQLDPVIELDFSANMTELTYLEFNSKHIHIVDENGEPILIDVIFPDTQVQKTFKKQLFVKPQKELEKGKTYTLIVDKEFMSKSGELGETISISFTTTTSEPDVTTTNERLENLKDNIRTFSTNEPTTKTTSTNITTEATSVTQPETKSNVKTVSIVSICIIVLVLLVATFVIRKQKS